MQLSKYIVEVPFRTDSIIFSTLSHAVIKLNKEKRDALISGSYTCFTDDELGFLKERHFLVDDRLNESKLLWHVLTKDRLHPAELSTFIVLSTACNFSCIYCYEDGQVDESTMSEETLSSTLKWYSQTLEKNRYSKCHVILYGGEPLLPGVLLKRFISEMENLTKTLGVDLSFSIITNGSLLTPETLNYLVSHNLKEIQVTLDGTQPIHDQRRMFKNGDGTFNIILENLKEVLSYNIDLTIRISFDSSNLHDIKNLIHLLKTEGFARPGVYIYFAPIHQTTVQKNNPCSFCSKNIYQCHGDIADIYCQLYEFSYAEGFWIPTYYTNGPCMMVGNDSSLISPNGDLYKCVEMINLPNLKVGSVYQTEYNSFYYDVITAPAMNECIYSECIYTPLCCGGCAMEAYLKNSDILSKVCHRDIFEKVTKHLLKLKYASDK